MFKFEDDSIISIDWKEFQKNELLRGSKQTCDDLPNIDDCKDKPCSINITTWVGRND